MTLLSHTGETLLSSTRNGATSGRPPNSAKIVLQPGLSIWKGTVSEEYLTELRPWNKAYKVFREMEDDAVIGTLYESVRVPLLDAKFTIEPASSSTLDIEAADFLRINTIDSPLFSWYDHVDEMLDMLAYGWALSEKVLEKGPNGTLYLTDLMPIGQDTLYKWGNIDNRGNIDAFQQIVYNDSALPKYNVAPIDKLLHYKFRARKRNPMGRSLSRNLYRPWYFKKNLEVVEAIGAERDVGNVPVAELGEGFYTADDMTSLREALEGLRIDETAYLIIPNGTKVQPFGSGGKVYDVRGIIRDYQHLIRQRFFMDFVSLGSEQVGTQALAKEVTGFFSLGLGSVQRQMTEVWNRQLVPWLFKWNLQTFGHLDVLPKIVWSRPGKLNLQSTAQSVSTLIGGQIIHWTPELEHHLRDAFELPAITPSELEELLQLEARQAQAAVEAQEDSTTPKGQGQVPGSGSKK